MAIDVLRAASDEQVIDLLRAIEDKLYETGTLVSVTGNPEADVTIEFRQVIVGGKPVVALAVQVTTDQPFESTSAHWDPLRHFVIEKYASLQCALPEPVRERLLDCPGPLVLVNGTRIS
ncbi:MAG: hypothetical protein ABFC67_15220 [Mizugakiibacter sp.]|uniref:hypothetical protein n=1 Tax=Mizugakiibacter sp. TaxID=1972610 RepID=UPI0031C44D01|nr:hypothetical protein [Xanthomonadaceae bacterium]